MNWLLGLCLLGVGIFAGSKFSYKYKKHLYFLQDFYNFLDYTQNNVNFLQDNIKCIISSKQDMYHSEFNDFLDKLQKDLSKSNIYIDDLINNGAIKNDEKQYLIKFFNEFGRLDVETQIASISQIKLGLDIYLKEAQEKDRKFGVLYKKLGIMCGLAMLVIVI